MCVCFCKFCIFVVFLICNRYFNSLYIYYSTTINCQTPCLYLRNCNETISGRHSFHIESCHCMYSEIHNMMRNRPKLYNLILEFSPFLTLKRLGLFYEHFSKKIFSFQIICKNRIKLLFHNKYGQYS